ncbi:MAG: hypothetical protein QW176_03225 [Candidatus Bathyarchaeia archaeon]
MGGGGYAGDAVEAVKLVKRLLGERGNKKIALIRKQKIIMV